MTLKRSNAPVPNTAMVMAAGKGTRMRPLTNDRPKPLVQVGGETLLDHVLGHLRSAGVGRIVVNVHYLADMVERHLAAHAADFDVAISDERGELLETGGGLIRAQPLLGADPFLCVNTDNIWTDGAEDSIVRLAAHWDDDMMDALMLVVPRERATMHAGHGDFDMDDVGRLSRLDPNKEKPWVWTGVQMLSQRLLVDPPSAAFSTNIFWNRAIEQGRMYGLAHEGAWFDVGTVDAIPVTEAALRDG
jgi:N-acetyl-alpha-D-muramate 1-phosphate uridylyltransferase